MAPVTPHRFISCLLLSLVAVLGSSAALAQTHSLTTSSSGGGTVTSPGDGVFTYEHGTSVPIVATADLHYHFMSWSGTAVTAGDVADPTSASTTVMMHSDFTLVANFQPDTPVNPQTLTTSSGGGGTVSSPGIGTFTYEHGTVVPVIAAHDPHYHFVSWSGTAVTAGDVADPTAASTTVRMHADFTLVANFSTYQVTLDTASGDGGSVTAPGEGSFTYSYGDVAPVTAAADSGYHFTGWVGTAVTAGKVADPAAESTQVTMEGNYTLIANFTAPGLESHTLTASSSAGGDVTAPGEGAFAYDHGTLVPIIAAPDAHYYFVSWTGTAVAAGDVADPTSSMTTVRMHNNFTLVANFSQDQQGLALTLSSGAGGTVSTPGEGVFTYAPGTVVSVAATAAPHYHFVSWSGTAVTAGEVANPASAGTTVTMHDDYTLVANFAIDQQTLTTSSGDNGSVTTPGEGTFTYGYGESASVVATPDAGYTFAGWLGTAVTAGKIADPTAASTTVAMEGNYTLVANFESAESEPRTLTVSSGDGGTVTTPGEGTFTYNLGTWVPVVATPDATYHFVNWTGTAVDAGDVIDPTSATTTVRIHSNFTLVANFAVDQSLLTLTTSAGAGGAVTLPGEGDFSYAQGTLVSVVASAGAGYHFVSWTGTAVTTGHVADPAAASTTVFMHGDFTLAANFALNPQVTLTSSAGDGGAVTSPGEGSFAYDQGTVVPVSATPDLHHHFVGWTGTAVDAGKVLDPSAASTMVAMDASYTLVASFALDQQMLTASSGDGGSVTTPGEGAFLYTYGQLAPVAATADAHYHFVSWTGTAVTAGKVAAPASASTTVTMDASYTLIANFAVDQQTLTTSSGDGGAVASPGEGSFTYIYGTVVPVIAAPMSHCHFVNWTGTAVTAGKVADPLSPSSTVTVDGSYTLIANFAVDQVVLAASSGDGGAVTLPGEGSFMYGYGAAVSVTATADPHYHFVSWTGTAVTAGKVAAPASASTTVTMDASYTLIANFAADQVTLTTSSGDGGAVSSPGEGSFTYNYGTVVPVTATAEAHYHFVSWTGTAVTAGKVAAPASASTTVTVDASYTLIANFAADQVTLTTSSGDGGAVSSPGEGSSTYNYGTVVPVTATAEAHYHFVSWTGTAVTAGKVADPASASTTVTVDASYTLVANFASDQLTLTTSSGDGGAVSNPGEGSFTYNYGTVVPVTATAEGHYHFVSWTGTAVTAGKVAAPASASTTVTVDASYTLVANFAMDQLMLTTSSDDGGAVTSPGEGAFTYSSGTVVPVTATAESHYHFVNWTGTAVTAGKVADSASASTTVLMDADYTLQANFAADTYTLTINAAHGSVTRTPNKVSYAYGQIVILQPTPDDGYFFAGWSGDLTGTGNPATITMDGNKTVTASFSPNPWTLITSSTAGGRVISPGEGTFQYSPGDNVMLEAEADPLFVFVGWRGGLSANSNPYSLTMDAGYTVKAWFESVLDVLYVDDNAPSDPGAGDPNLSDPAEDGTLGHPFDTIQEAIDVAKPGAKVIVRSGTYAERIDLLGKHIEVNGLNSDLPGVASLPVIDGQGKGTVVLAGQHEDADSMLIGFVITGGRGHLAGGILCVNSSPTLSNCLIVGNRATGPDGVGGGIYCQDSKATIINCTISGNYGSGKGAGLSFKDSQAVVVNSIIWANSPSEIQAAGTVLPAIGYTDVAGGWSGTGNLNADPLFAAAGYWANPSDLTSPVSPSVAAAVWVAGDYHVKSQAGRWNPVTGLWVKDAVTSPCIDGGSPASVVGPEPSPNGSRINLGAYGGTDQASQTRP